MNRNGFILAAMLTLAAGPALAQDYKLGAIEIEHPWARATPKGATVGAGYMTISNKGAEADRLVGGSVAFARRFEIHSMITEQGVMKMREVKDGLEIKAGETVQLKPGGYHVMFVDLKEPLAQGDHVKVTLTFAKAGTIDVEYPVEAMGAATGGGHDMKMGR
jgi:periplasmic copper chaperone A